MNINPQTRLVLDPQFCLRNDVDRAVLITRPQPLSFDKGYVTRLLHPKEAVLLALMDGDRTVEQLASLWADLLNRTPEAAAAEIDRLIRFYTTGELATWGFLANAEAVDPAQIRSYDPMDFIVPANRVNLTDHRFRRPYTVYLLPTLFCPQKCVYCYAKTEARPEADAISVGRLREIFEEISALGVEVIQLSGGDPFARGDIFEILESIVQAGMIPDIPTKLGLSYEEALRLKDLGVQLVQVSLDSSEPQVVDRMVGVAGYHRRVTRVLGHLRQAGLKVRVNCVLTPYNAPTIGSLLDYLGEMGNVVRVSLTPYGRSLFCHSNDLFVEAQNLAQVEEQRRRRVPLYPHMRMSLGGINPPLAQTFEEKARRWKQRAMCTANRHGFIILPDGRVTVCEELYDHPRFIIGDLRRQSVMEMWTSPEALALLQPDQALIRDGPCKTCGEFSECSLVRGRCWRDVLKAYGWDKPDYPDPRCPHAPPGRRLS